MNIFNSDGDTGVFYSIQSRNRCYKSREWSCCVGDHHGHPPGFTASDEMWQKYGIFATKDLAVAESALAAFVSQYPETDFRIMKSRVIVINEPQPEVCGTGETPPTTSSYPNDEHYEHVRRCVTVSGGVPPDYVVDGAKRWLKSKSSAKRAERN